MRSKAPVEGPFETGLVRISTSGRVSVYTGAAQMGKDCVPRLLKFARASLDFKLKTSKS